jgi:hypothetical protein
LVGCFYHEWGEIRNNNIIISSYYIRDLCYVCRFVSRVLLVFFFFFFIYIIRKKKGVNLTLNKR